MKLVPVTTAVEEEDVAVEVADMGEVVEGAVVMAVEEVVMVAEDMEAAVEAVAMGVVDMEVAVMEAEVMAEAVMEDTVVVDTEAAVMEDTEEDVVEDMVGVVTEDTEEDVMGDMVAVDINSLQPFKTYSTVLFEIFPAFTNNWKSLIWSDSTSALHFVFRRTELYFCRIS